MRPAITAFVLLPLALGAAAQSFDQAARQTMTIWQLPAMAVAVVQNDKVVFLQAYGVKELGQPQPVSIDTLFQIGSTTKAFTTTAMAMLADEKKLSWDDPVRRHLEYFHLSDPCADARGSLRMGCGWYSGECGGAACDVAGDGWLGGGASGLADAEG